MSGCQEGPALILGVMRARPGPILSQIKNKLSTWNGPIHWFFSSLAIYLHFAKIILTIAIAVMLQILYRNLFIFLNGSKMGFLSSEMRLRWYFSLYVNICIRAVTIKETANLSTQQALTPYHFLIRNVLTQCDSVFFLTFINQEMTFFVEIICLDGVFFSYYQCSNHLSRTYLFLIGFADGKMFWKLC